MRMTLTETSFIRMINEHFPSRKNYFSYNGLQAMFEDIQEYEDATGEQREFDYIELCGIYDEFDSLKDLQSQHNFKNLKAENRVIEFDNWTDRNTGEYLRTPNKSFLVICN